MENNANHTYTYDKACLYGFDSDGAYVHSANGVPVHPLMWSDFTNTIQTQPLNSFGFCYC